MTAPEESLPSQSAGALFCGTVVDGSGVALEDVGEGLGTDGHRAAHKLRNVVALQELTVVVGVGTGQLEGFGALAVLVDVGEERAQLTSRKFLTSKVNLESRYIVTGTLKTDDSIRTPLATFRAPEQNNGGGEQNP